MFVNLYPNSWIGTSQPGGRDQLFCGTETGRSTSTVAARELALRGQVTTLGVG